MKDELPNVHLDIRQAAVQDRQHLANLIYFELHVHRHLDWRAPLEWIGEQPFLVAEKDGEVVGTLACPIEPTGVAWIRLFAAHSMLSERAVWQSLWQHAEQALARPTTCVALVLDPWFGALLAQSGFEHTHDVVVLVRDHLNDLPVAVAAQAEIRPMTVMDLPAVAAVDAAAFRPVWQNSLMLLTPALAQSACASVACVDGRVVGYQLSTTSQMGGHIARLAVHPEYQGRQLGQALLHDVLTQFAQAQTRRISVNTQQDNAASLHLYARMGFRRLDEAYQVYERHLTGV